MVIFQSDCNTILLNNEFLVLPADTISFGDGYNNIETKILVNNVTFLQLSSIFNTSTSSADLFVRTGLYYNIFLINETEFNFLETIMSLYIDLTVEVVTFDITTNLNWVEAEEEGKEMTYEAYIID